MDAKSSFSGVKWQERETDHSPPSSAKVSFAWIYTSILPYVVMEWCLIEYRDNFIFISLIYTSDFVTISIEKTHFKIMEYDFVEIK
jgi:hypothetical protein